MPESPLPVRLRVVEIFDSIQGEGIYVGMPSTFVRLAGCNQRCSWCDTPYAYVHRFEEKDVGTELTVDWIVDRLVNCCHVVITGGEPLLQPIEELIARMPVPPITTVETNGTIYPGFSARERVTLWSVSPKLPSSGHQADLEVLKHFVADQKIQLLQFKFVVVDQNDLIVMTDLLERLESPRELDVVVQPMCTMTEKDCWSNAVVEYMRVTGMLVDLVFRQKLNVRIIPQLQKLIWGNVRGR